MIVALIILAALVCVGLCLYLLDKREAARPEGPSQADSTQGETATPTPSAPPDEDSEVCCGMHLTCEKDSLLADVSDRIEYFDDEELDRFAGRAPDSYTPEEIDEFRDVLMTLIPTDIAPWARSVQLRGIHLPPDIREELLFLVAEARQGKVTE